MKNAKCKMKNAKCKMQKEKVIPEKSPPGRGEGWVYLG